MITFGIVKNGGQKPIGAAGCGRRADNSHRPIIVPRKINRIGETWAISESTGAGPPGMASSGDNWYNRRMISESSANLNPGDPDVQLMLAVRRDDTAAFEELMQRYQGRVISLLRHIVGNRDLAEDLTQEVFLRVFRARKNYQPGSSRRHAERQ